MQLTEETCPWSAKQVEVDSRSIPPLLTLLSPPHTSVLNAPVVRGIEVPESRANGAGKVQSTPQPPKL